MNADKKADHAAEVDMVDGLIDYANQHAHTKDVAQAVLAAATPDLTGLDTLFKDGGIERKDFLAIATGYITDRYHLTGDDLASKRNDLIAAAIHILKDNPKAFDAWVR